MASGRQPATTTPPRPEDSASLGNVLSSSLDMLKIEDAEIRKKAVEFVGNVSLATVNAYGKWIASIKAVADACTVSGHAFSQSELCDFLTVAAKGMDSKRAGTKAVNDATFYIYMDIMENYQKASAQLKLHFPRIIVDVISILDKGVDTRGEAVGVYGIERYYQEHKASAPLEDPVASYIARSVTEGRRSSSSSSSSSASQPSPPAVTFSDDLVDNLASITGRSKKELEASLASLPAADIKKITDLSVNHKRLQKYSKLARPEDLKREVEKDLGRKLTDNQLQHAANSIRKAKTYIENVLDGKFVPHGTHGINHVKHNLEYGYQLMGLIEPRKRRSN
ncbi:hypothetical protein [Nitrososphaera viennensis]|uniref:Uncharacterized protein n=2 Tax=Nitrososphaera viennensis TaxID=1034015 RepID=A0A060HN22_9ARCH|nr:hypothetical protein [Nitrososphaera viennensis]AIC14622.1 hypothetical protein NVIE_004270 [Nitrososphaera viennensis EN76]UVS69586.1 hypothetical protein NWT39_02085 [Nitrososphaera viennensis]